MNLTEIKKEFYKKNPKARFVGARKGTLHYITTIGKGLDCKAFYFHIPMEDMGDASFEPEMEAKHLIRYIVLPNTETK